MTLKRAHGTDMSAQRGLSVASIRGNLSLTPINHGLLQVEDSTELVSYLCVVSMLQVNRHHVSMSSGRPVSQ